MNPPRIPLARLLIAMVLLLNLQCALAFLLSPQAYLTAFGLSGEGGLMALRGMGLLFFMWNVPYAFALIHPIRNRLSLIEAVLMQGIGVLGEGILLLGGGISDAALRSSLTRFLLFDSGGLLLLLLAYALSAKAQRSAP